MWRRKSRENMFPNTIRPLKEGKKNHYFHLKMFALGATMGIAGWLGVEAWQGIYYSRFAENAVHIRSRVQEFGTLSNPSYLVLPSSLGRVHTLDESLEKCYSEYDRKLDAAQEKLNAIMRSRLREGIREADREDISFALDPHQYPLTMRYCWASLFWHQHEVDSSDKIPNWEPVEFKDQFEIPRKKKEGQKDWLMTDVIPFGNDVFKQLTGKPVPKSLQALYLSSEKIAENTVGFHIAFGKNPFIDLQAQKWKSVDGALLIYLHEMGHVAYQGHEDAVSSFLFNGLLLQEAAGKDKREVGIMEEAAAYLMEGAGIGILERTNPYIGKPMRGAFARHLELKIVNYEGAKEPSPHAEGAMLAVAIVDRFGGDVNEAFRYLSTRNSFGQLDKRIRQTYEGIASGELPLEGRYMRQLEGKREVLEMKARDIGIEVRRF